MDGVTAEKYLQKGGDSETRRMACRERRRDFIFSDVGFFF